MQDVGVALDVLGPLRLRVGEVAVDVAGHKRRAVLALLAMSAPHGLSVDGFVEALWPGVASSGRTALQSQVSRLRRQLGPAASRLEATDGGYRLALGADELDARVVERLLARAHAIADGDASAALDLLRQAASCWRGPALDGLRDVVPLAAWAVALDELRVRVAELRADCALGAGAVAEAVEIASDAVLLDPLREQPMVLLVRALASAGRPVDALRAAHEYRRRLAEETGLEPTAALTAAEHAVAAGTPPAPRVVAAPARVVPVPASPLIGREAEVAGVSRLLESERLVTIVGPAGVGKTHLALELANRVGTAREVVVVRLAPLTDPAALPQVLAASLDLRGVQGDTLTAVATVLAAGDHLLVLDNCEHVLDAARRAVDVLASMCPRLTILATSRERIALPFEQVCPLAPLALPAAGQSARVEEVPSVALFLDRARRACPGLVVDRAQLATVVTIVTRLDGIPLALELAAGRLVSMTLDDLASRLDRSLDLLARGRSPDDRHATLRAAIAWSYSLLPDDEQRLFRHLAVFPDGFDLATAEAVAAELGTPVDPAHAVGHLVDASMLVTVHGDVPRYRMLHALRMFGVDRLRAAGEEQAATSHLLAWAAAFVAWVAATIRTDDEPVVARRLRAEFGNLRAAWNLVRDGADTVDLDLACRVVDALQDAASWRDLTEFQAWAIELSSDPQLADHPRAAAVLAAASEAQWMARGDLDAAERLARRGLELARSDDADARQRCAIALADVEMFRGRGAEARQLALGVADQSPLGAFAYDIAALSAAYDGDVELARLWCARATQVGGFPTMRGFTEYVAGEIANVAGNWPAAEAHYLHALHVARLTGATFLEAIASVGLVSAYAAGGRYADALAGYRELLDYWERTGSWVQQWTTLRNVADVLEQLGDGETAKLLHDTARRAPEAAAFHRAGEDAVATRRIPSGTLAVANRDDVVVVARRAIDRALRRVALPERPAAQG